MKLWTQEMSDAISKHIDKVTNLTTEQIANIDPEKITDFGEERG